MIINEIALKSSFERRILIDFEVRVLAIYQTLLEADFGVFIFVVVRTGYLEFIAQVFNFIGLKSETFDNVDLFIIRVGPDVY